MNLRARTRLIDPYDSVWPSPFKTDYDLVVEFIRRTRMLTGTIKRLVSDKGFGFIEVVKGREFFFHRSGVVGDTFDNLREGQKVTFEEESSPKGPRATNVQGN